MVKAERTAHASPSRLGDTAHFSQRRKDAKDGKLQHFFASLRLTTFVDRNVREAGIL
jgi:hypothetical protein